MAFSSTGFFTVMGKYIKAINVYDGYIDAIEAHKGAIYTVQAAQGVQDLYAPLPALFAGLEDQVTSWIFSLISDLQNLILNRDYVIEQLVVADESVNGVFSALFDYMVLNNVTIKTSVVSLAGSDVNEKASLAFDASAANSSDLIGPRLYATRILDGFNPPGSGLQADSRYAGIEGQLSKSTTIYADIVGDTPNNQVVRIYSTAQETGPFVLQGEEPGEGGSLNNAEANNMLSNYDMTSWTGNNPNLWSITGGSAGTDWVDDSGTGAGPLQINTVNVKGVQKISGLNANQMYFIALSFDAEGVSGGLSTVGVKVRNLAASTTYMTQRTYQFALATVSKGQAFGFFYLSEDVDLEDIYAEFQLTAKDADTDAVRILKLVCCPAVYYNGLGLAWWAPIANFTNGFGTFNYARLGGRNSLVVANNGGGVFQSFIRKAYGIQLPTNDSPSVSEGLAT